MKTLDLTINTVAICKLSLTDIAMLSAHVGDRLTEAAETYEKEETEANHDRVIALQTVFDMVNGRIEDMMNGFFTIVPKAE